MYVFLLVCTTLLDEKKSSDKILKIKKRILGNNLRFKCIEISNKMKCTIKSVSKIKNNLQKKINEFSIYRTSLHWFNSENVLFFEEYNGLFCRFTII